MELLMTTNDKTYIIAEKVGYADPNYFSYAFKKQYGVCHRPSIVQPAEAEAILTTVGRSSRLVQKDQTVSCSGKKRGHKKHADDDRSCLLRSSPYAVCVFWV